MTHNEAQFVEKLLERRSLHSVGRYIFELPEAFSAHAQALAVVDQVQIQVQPMSRAAFDGVVENRELDLRRKSMDGEPANPFLKRVESPLGFTPGEVLRIFNRAEDSGSADFARTLELWAWKESYLIRLSVKATESEGTAYASKPWIKDFPTDTPQKLDHLLSVYGRVRGRKENEIPTERGDCIVNGFVAGPPSDQQAMNVSYQLQGSPDLYFNFNHSTTVRESESLLARAAKIEQETRSSGTQTVRTGRRDIGGLSYEEWLMRGPTPDRVTGTMFVLHGNETASDPAKPFVKLQLFNGFRVPAPERTLEQSAHLKDLEKSTLTEAQAIALWDRVVSTLRVRPGAL